MNDLIQNALTAAGGKLDTLQARNKFLRELGGAAEKTWTRLTVDQIKGLQISNEEKQALLAMDTNHNGLTNGEIIKWLNTLGDSSDTAQILKGLGYVDKAAVAKQETKQKDEDLTKLIKDSKEYKAITDEPEQKAVLAKVKKQFDGKEYKSEEVTAAVTSARGEYKAGLEKAKVEKEKALVKTVTDSAEYKAIDSKPEQEAVLASVKKKFEGQDPAVGDVAAAVTKARGEYKADVEKAKGENEKALVKTITESAEYKAITDKPEQEAVLAKVKKQFDGKVELKAGDLAAAITKARGEYKDETNKKLIASAKETTYMTPHGAYLLLKESDFLEKKFLGNIANKLMPRGSPIGDAMLDHLTFGGKPLESNDEAHIVNALKHAQTKEGKPVVVKINVVENGEVVQKDVVDKEALAQFINESLVRTETKRNRDGTKETTKVRISDKGDFRELAKADKEDAKNDPNSVSVGDIDAQLLSLAKKKAGKKGNSIGWEKILAAEYNQTYKVVSVSSEPAHLAKK